MPPNLCSDAGRPIISTRVHYEVDDMIGPIGIMCWVQRSDHSLAAFPCAATLKQQETFPIAKDSEGDEDK